MPGQSTEIIHAEFFITEALVFVSQVVVFFLVAFFTSDLLRNEERLAEFAASKINNNTISELGLTLLAITFALGSITFIKEVAPPSGIIERLSREVLHELPRTIYFFGSSLTAITLATAIFISNHPQPNSKPAVFVFMSSFSAITAFVYGCGLKTLLIKKERQKNLGSKGAENDS